MMNPFLPFYGFAAAAPVAQKRDLRLRDLDARMGAFLAEKQISGDSCDRVLDNVKGSRSRLRGELHDNSHVTGASGR